MTTKHYFSSTIFLFLLLFQYSNASAQLSYGGEPYQWRDKQWDSGIPVIETPGLDMNQIAAQDAINDKEKTLPFRFGIEHDVHYTSNDQGRWITHPETGELIWQLAIHCPEALSINITFDEFKVPKGARVFIWTSDRMNFLGGFDSRNNEDNGVFATGILHADKIVVECIVPQSHKNDLHLSIGQIVHGYRPILQSSSEVDTFNNRGPFGNSGNCHNNVICPVAADWQVEKRSVVLILLGGSLCSGSLVNNTANDGTPYILTANHCTPTNNNVSNWVFYFNHESSTCSGNTGPTNNSISGATFKAKRAASDFALVEMNDTPPSSWNVQYAGWDATGSTNISNTVGIHHPAGDVKKISFDNDAPMAFNDQGTYVWYISEWEDGVTEGGSSGSPLFDPNHRIIGQLYAGTSDCNGTNENDGYDIYGRFDVSWDAGNAINTRLKEWLDPLNTGQLVLDGYPEGSVEYALDATLMSIGGLDQLICGPNATPTVTLRNNGTQNLTSCTIQYQVNNGSTQTQSWTGSLAQNQTTVISLPQLTLTTTNNTLQASVINPNGNTDQNPGNNTISQTFTAAINNPIGLTLQITFDEYPTETSWIFRNSNNQIVYTSSPYNDSYAETETTQNFCFVPGCYSFTISDSAGDGICCDYGNGSYQLLDENDNVLASGGNFTTSQVHNFCLNTSEIESPSNAAFNLYPNPSDGTTTLRGTERINTLTIRDITGKILWHKTIGTNQYTVETSHLPSGIYFCEITTSQGSVTQKLVVKH